MSFSNCIVVKGPISKESNKIPYMLIGTFDILIWKYPKVYLGSLKRLITLHEEFLEDFKNPHGYTNYNLLMNAPANAIIIIYNKFEFKIASNKEFTPTSGLLKGVEEFLNS